ncbi:hypothetical protein OAC91_02380 [Candidatus Marinimicrobia bacterium]|nr:hypothetical protein [Candidatus Neomarinimicrobiota bacterium]
MVLTATVVVITELNASNSGISDLTGIEAFTALIYLYANDNQLTFLDVSANTASTNRGFFVFMIMCNIFILNALFKFLIQ